MTSVEPRVGATLGRYLLQRRLGSGGMGTVYEASHTLLGSRVALKVLNADVAANREVVDRFFREGQAAARIQHRHVVRVTDVDTQNGVTFLVMEHLEGEDLATRLRRAGSLSLETTLEILLPVMDAIAAAHAALIVHRDLKPENIFLTTGRRGELHPKVLDFGISKLLDAQGGLASLTRAHTTLGTPHYMSPEQAIGANRVGPPTDQYALGTILFECLTGRHPFENDNVLELLDAIVHEPPPRLCVLAPGLPEAVDAIVSRALSKDPAARFASVTVLARELLPFASEGARSFWAQELVDADAPTVSRRMEAAGFEEAATAVEPFGGVGLEGASFEGASFEGASFEGASFEGADTAIDTTLGGSAREVAVAPVSAPAPRRWLLAVAVAALVIGGAVSFLVMRPGAREVVVMSVPTVAERAPLVVSVRTEPPSATLELDGAPVGVGSFEREMPASERRTLRVSAEGYEPQTFVFVDAPPPSVVRLRPIAAPEAGESSVGEAPRPLPRARSRPVRVRNRGRADVSVTFTCGEDVVRADVAARDTRVVRVGRGACTVVCEGERDPRCPSRLSRRQSAVVVR